MKTYRNVTALAVLSLLTTTALGWDFAYDGKVNPHQLVNTSPDWEYGDSGSSSQDYDSILPSAEAQAGNAILDRNDDNSGGQPRFYGLRFGIVACDSEWPGTLKATLVIRCKNLETDYVGNPDGDINTEGKALLDIRDGASNRWNLAQTEKNQWVLDCRNDRASGRTDLRPMLVGEADDWHVFRIVVASDGVSTTYTVYYDEAPTPIQTVTHAETIAQLRFELSRSSDLNRQRWQIDWIRAEVGEAWSPSEGDQIPRWPVAWYVAPPPLGSDTNPGTSEHPFATIQRGIDAASDGDTVIVAEGTYVENIQFNGKNLVLTSTDPLNPTIVAATIIDGGQSGSVVTFSGTETEACVLSGFTLHNGEGYYGGGICGGTETDPTHATIENNTITGNWAVGSDGVPGNGGGVAFCDGTIWNNTIMRNNTASSPLDWTSGGGVYQCHGTIENNTIIGNSADDGGGLYDCDGAIRSNLIADNYGGGLHYCNGTIENNTITGNSARWEGGGLAYCGGTIQNNMVTGNSAGWGGGLHDCDGLIQNNTIADNLAGWGGGLVDCDGTIRNNTVADNYGGGVSDCKGTIRNCILWGNAALSGPQLYGSSIPSFSCIEGWSGGGQGNIASDPRFLNRQAHDYHLQEDSPCIDAGANGYWFTWPQRDADGNCRLAGLGVDMGSYEYGSSADADGDLFSDTSESAAGTNPLKQDSDGDGLRDGLELLRGSDPLHTTAPGVLHVPSDFATVQESLCVSIAGDEIIVAPGTYGENLQFGGSDIILRSSDPGDPSVVASTVIDGGGAGPVVSFMGGESEACVLAGFTIHNGEWGNGGGIDGNGTLATIQNNTIANNSGRNGGGLADCNGTIENNTITGNKAAGLEWEWDVGHGGGLYQCNGTIHNNTIWHNSAEYGGGLAYCNGRILNNTVAHNYGAGLALCGGTIQNNTITDNSSQRAGGGLASCDGMIQNNTIADNYGGGLAWCGGTIQNNTITDNSSQGDGGGLYNCHGTIQNNTIRGNLAAQYGGGLCECGGTIQNNTIAGNSAGWEGGGLDWCRGTIRNCIIWGNTAPTGPQLEQSGDPTYSCIEGWTGDPNTGNISGDPRFAGADTGNFRLLPSSPCIDAGYSHSEPPAIDVAGMHRVMYGGKSLTVDMGAYEYYVNALSRELGGNAVLTWSSLAGKTYSVLVSSDMFTWETAAETVPSLGDTVTTWTDATSPFIFPSVRIRYYRAVEK